ncbi:MAG: peptidoglycan DD-metalloendopeptidase family protein [Actinomycetes bacterium]
MHRRPAGRLATAAVCVAALLAGPAPAGAHGHDGSPAARQRDAAEVLQQVRDELAESSEAMVAAAADLRLAERALPGAHRAAEHAREALAAARLRQQAASRRRAVAQARLMLASQDADATAALVDEQRARIGRLARAAYQGGGPLAQVSMVLEARSPADFTERLVAWESVVSSQRGALADLQLVQDTLGDRTADLEHVRDELTAANEQAQAELAAVADLEARARLAEQEVGRLVAAREAALAAAKAAQAEDEQRMQRLQGESTRLSAMLAKQATEALGADGARAGSSVPPVPGTLAWPVRARISSPYGMRTHPITGVHKLHTGVDLSAPCGTPIGAARDGTVIVAEYNQAYGWRTVVSHGVVGRVLLTTTYNHQPGLGVEVGQRVRAGDVIGWVGSTGYSTGCHLHFELVVNSELVDPVPWLPAG